MSIETRSITLSSYDINPSVNINDYATNPVTTSNGTIGQQFQYMIWNNVNLQNLVGSAFYNTYSKFTIRLLHCSVGDLCGNSTYGFDAIAESRVKNANAEFILNGLDFNPLPYSHTNPANTGASMITAPLRQLPSSAVAIPTFTSAISTINNIHTLYKFNKPTGNLTLKIDRIIPSTNTYASTTAFGYGHYKFIFEIRGIL